jgi:tRNA modification GTPase
MASATGRGLPAKARSGADHFQALALASTGTGIGANGTAGLPGPGVAGNGAVSSVPPPPVWVVWNKIDTVNSHFENLTKAKDEGEFLKSNNELAVSALTGEGMNQAIDLLTLYASEYFGSEAGLVTRERHRRALMASCEALDRALAEGSEGREDIIAEELRLAARALGRLTGRVDVEDILDAIFRDFCIGK